MNNDSLNFNSKIEIIFVIDGGKIDYSKELKKIKSMILSNIDLKIFCSKKNLGQLHATVFGILMAEGERIVTYDVDHYKIDNIFLQTLKVTTDDFILYSLDEANKPIARKVGASIYHFIHKIFLKKINLKGSSIRNIKKKYLDKISFYVKNNYILLDHYLILHTNSIKEIKIASVYSNSSYSLYKLTELFLSNILARVTKKTLNLNTYKKL